MSHSYTLAAVAEALRVDAETVAVVAECDLGGEPTVYDPATGTVTGVGWDLLVAQLIGDETPAARLLDRVNASARAAVVSPRHAEELLELHDEAVRAALAYGIPAGLVTQAAACA